MYGRGPPGAQRFCKECTKSCNRPISYENGLSSFGSGINLTSREKVSVHWGKKIFFGGEACLGLKPPPPPPPPH